MKIYRCLSESYFGLKQYANALKNIDNAIDLSDFDENHVEFKEKLIKPAISG